MGSAVSCHLAERVGHRLQADLKCVAVFARELPRGNARTGHPPLQGNECAVIMLRIWVVPRKNYDAFRPLFWDEGSFFIPKRKNYLDNPILNGGTVDERKTERIAP